MTVATLIVLLIVIAGAVWLIRQRKVNAMARTLGDADGRIADLSADLAKHAALVDTGMREVAAMETTVAQMRDAAADQLEVIEQLRTELQSATAAKEQWASRARQIAEEAARLRGLALTFERWHEQMISLMTQNQDMHAKNHELASIVRHVLIVSLNASIEAARAGAAGRGFGIVASEVRALATRSEELSKSYRDSLHRNDVTTTATFQDIQAGGKMIAASLSSVEALAQQLHARLH